MWRRPFDPTDRRQVIALYALTGAALALAMITADGLIPALVRWQLGGGQ
jgi:hypothetical protein